jgi:hypothetical protein
MPLAFGTPVFASSKLIDGFFLYFLIFVYLPIHINVVIHPSSNYYCFNDDEFCPSFSVASVIQLIFLISSSSTCHAWTNFCINAEMSNRSPFFQLQKKLICYPSVQHIYS